MTEEKSKIFLGDNLDWLNKVVDNSIDLCYIDPPFFTQKTFINLKSGASFQDKFDSLSHYINWLRPRIELIHKKLKNTGTIFLHCDWHASHRIRCLLDEVFGEERFVNEIIWFYKGAGVPKDRFSKRHDTIFWYSKSDSWVFNVDNVRIEYSETTKQRFKHHIGNKRNGKDFGTQELNSKGKHPEDVFEIPFIAPSAKERVGYPTQKPVALLERIILCSTNEGDTVLDCFAGSGTTAFAAKRLNRNYIVGDESEQAVEIIKERLG